MLDGSQFISAICVMLKDVNSEVHAEFQNGGFTINKTENPFLTIAIDQAQ